MTTSKPTSYIVDYYYQKSGSGSKTRTQLNGSVSQHLQGGTTENSVLNYLKKKHSGYEITLMNLTWK